MQIQFNNFLYSAWSAAWCILTIQYKLASRDVHQLTIMTWCTFVQWSAFQLLRKMETAAFTYKWTELETVILNEVTQAYKEKHHVFFSLLILTLSL